MKKSLILFAAAAFALASCGSKTDGNAEGGDSTSAETTEVAEAGDGYNDFPWEFPKTIDLEFEPGQYYLAPHTFYPSAVEEKKDLTKEVLIFYSDTYNDVTDGKVNGKTPTSLCIPLPKGATAKKGDVVLTWWQSGSGLQRALVTDDSAADAPKTEESTESAPVTEPVSEPVVEPVVEAAPVVAEPVVAAAPVEAAPAVDDFAAIRESIIKDLLPIMDHVQADPEQKFAMYKKAYGNTDGINGQADTQNESQFAEAIAKFTNDTVKAHADKRGLANGVHGATSEPVAGQIASRDENGNMEAGSAIKDKDVINKEYLTNVIDNLMKNKVYPVGKSFFTENPADPATYLGFGTWVRIKGKFLWALDDKENVGVTGGSKTVTLTKEQIPSHTHTFTGSAVTSGGSSATNTGSENSHTHGVGSYQTYWSVEAKSTGNYVLYTGESSNLVKSSAVSITYTTKSGINHSGAGSYAIPGKVEVTCKAGNDNSFTGSSAAGSSHSHTMAHTHSVTASGTISVKTNPTFTGSAVTSGAESQNHTHSVTASGTNGNTGGGQSHDNMPPYEGYYCWKRIA